MLTLFQVKIRIVLCTRIRSYRFGLALQDKTGKPGRDAQVEQPTAEQASQPEQAEHHRPPKQDNPGVRSNPQSLTHGLFAQAMRQEFEKRPPGKE